MIAVKVNEISIKNIEWIITTVCCFYGYTIWPESSEKYQMKKNFNNHFSHLKVKSVSNRYF
jgi:hypothetical protein